MKRSRSRMSGDGGFEILGMEEFAKQLRKIGDENDKKIGDWLEAIGITFIEEIQDQILQYDIVDTRRLLSSFGKGNTENVWNFMADKLRLEIGTNVEYAALVNDGHWTVNETSWVNGRPYFDLAFEIFKRMFYSSLEVKLTEIIEGAGD